MRHFSLLSRIFATFAIFWFGNVNAATAESEAERVTREGAPARIIKYRQGDVSLQVIGTDGKPIAGVKVQVHQARHEFLFGCNIFALEQLQKTNPAMAQKYGDQFAEIFNFATLPFYWWSYEREQDKPEHASRKAVAKWCKEHNITTKGHPLLWNFGEAKWLPDATKKVQQLQLARTEDCVATFRDEIQVWDVVNEATNFNRGSCQKRAPKLTQTWQEVGQDEFTRQAFHAARKGNPKATLLINDYDVSPKYAELVKKIVDKKGAPLYDVIGLQSHMHGGVWSTAKVWQVCERFKPFNKPLHFTELTILSGAKGWQRPKPWPSTPEGEAEQAKEVKRIYTLLFSHPSVEAITWWDFADLRAWQGAPAGLLRDDLSPKPAYKALRKLIKEDWWTTQDLTTDASGTAKFRGFHGDYNVTITLPDGKKKTMKGLQILRATGEKPTSWRLAF